MHFRLHVIRNQGYETHDIGLVTQRSKYQSPTCVHCQQVFQLSPDVSCHPILQ